MPTGSRLIAAAGLLLCAGAAAQTLPQAYVSAMEEGLARVEQRLRDEPAADLRAIEERAGWRHFPHALLAAAALRREATALRIGDLAADADERGLYYWRQDSYWDTYMWLEAYRLLEARLSPERRRRWRACLERNVAMVAPRCAEWRDLPAYTQPFLGTSTNHFALWALNLTIAGRLFTRPEWAGLGDHILHRLATEQSPDGYWGEFSPAGPTSGYNLLTLAAVGVYYAYTKDPAALQAMRRATGFHSAFTQPDGKPAAIFNDRNRHWDLSLYGNFAFSHSAAGRRLAQFFFAHFPPQRLDMEALGRIAQNRLYYQEGPLAPIPLDRAEYRQRLAGPAGIRKSAGWITCLSGLIATRPVLSQWFLDRQSHVSVFHQKLGAIIHGGNSRNQPELATFTETLSGVEYGLPLASRYEAGEIADRLWLAYNSFFAEIEIPRAAVSEVRLRFVVSGRGPAPQRARLALQLCLHPGEELDTGAGAVTRLGREPISVPVRRLRHHGWTLDSSADATLDWPVFPYSPYRNGPETSLEQAVGVLTIPLRLQPEPERFVRVGEQVIEVTVGAP